MSTELRLAQELDRALAGAEAGTEARDLAALLQAAAEPLKLVVEDVETERALRSLSPPPRRRALPRLVPALGLALAAAAAAALVWTLRTPGIDVQARAARAVDAPFFVVEQVRPARAGLFRPTDVSGYVDGSTGRAHVRVSTADGLVAETVVRRGSVERWVAASDTLFAAPSCAALAGGCAEVLDPLDLYVRALDDPRFRSERVGDAYRLTLHSGRLALVVEIAARTYLPRRIEWLQDGRRVAAARVVALDRGRSPLAPEAWAMSPHPGARVVQVVAGGAHVRVVSTRPAAPGRDVLWLGPSYGGHRARVERVTFTAGSATRIAYGPLVVWDYGAIVPPPVLQVRTGEAKIFAVRGGVAHVYYPQQRGKVVADLQLGGRNVAIVDRSGDNVAAVSAIQALRHPGSP